MFTAILLFGSVCLVVGGILLLIDCYRIHWGWAVGSFFFPPASFFCVAKNWHATKRGFLLSLLSLPFFIVVVFLALKPNATAVASGKPVHVHERFVALMDQARAAVDKLIPSHGKTAVGKIAKNPPPTLGPAVRMTPPPTVAERWTTNRIAFADLKTQFATLAGQRKTLSKTDPKAIFAFNLAAQKYSEKLAATRSEQGTLLQLGQDVRH